VFVACIMYKSTRCYSAGLNKANCLKAMSDPVLKYLAANIHTVCYLAAMTTRTTQTFDLATLI
jgi:hypothetical protein